MQPTVVDLCSSPEPEPKPVPRSKEQLLALEDNKHVPNSLSLEWYELSSDFSGKADDQSSPNGPGSLPSIFPCSEKCPVRDSTNNIIDLVSDDTETVKSFSKEYKPAVQVDKKEDLSPCINLNSYDLSLNKESSPGTGPANHLDIYGLSDPFASSPVKKRRVSSLTHTRPPSTSLPVVELYQNSLEDVNIIETYASFNDIRPASGVNKSILDFDPSDLFSSPSTHELPEIGKPSKIETTLILSEDESDEEWIRELLATNTGLKRGGNKNPTSKPHPGLHQLEKDSGVEKVSGSRNILMPVVNHNSEDGNKRMELNRKNTEKKECKKTSGILELNKRKAKVKKIEKALKLKEQQERNRIKELNATLVKINKLKDRLESTSEMIVDLPVVLDEKLADQVKVFLDGVNAKHDSYNCSNSVIKWRRKVRADWDAEKGHWQPTPERIQDEKYVMCILKAQELLELIQGVEGHDLNAHILKLKVEYSGKEIIFLVEGLRSWLSKNKSTKNREFTDAVRSQISNSEAPSTTVRRRCKKTDQEYIDQTLIDIALIKLHVLYQVLIHHTQNLLDTAEWVMRFTQHISTIPYRKQLENINTSNFCIETGQIDSGKDAKDTYILMLQQMRLVTPSVAWGIQSKYANVQTLIRGLEEEGPLALEQCRKSANKNGAFTDARIGQAISRRVYSVFLGTDPWSSEI